MKSKQLKVERGILRSASGLILDPLNPSPASIRLDDIIRGLSNLPRFTGQGSGNQREPWSVLEHSMIVWLIVKKRGGSIDEQLAAALHDATEAYYNDLPSPLKSLCPQYKRLERPLQRVIFKKYGLSPEIPSIVDEADDLSLFGERDLALSRFYPLGSLELRRRFKSIVLHLLEEKAFTDKDTKWLKHLSI